MINELISAIAMENATTSEEDLMSENTDSSVRDSFIGEDGEVIESDDVSEDKIRDLIKNIPGTNANSMTKAEVKTLAEGFTDIFESHDYLMEGSVNIDSLLEECKNNILMLESQDNLSDEDKAKLQEEKKKAATLKIVKDNAEEAGDDEQGGDPPETEDVKEQGSNYHDEDGHYGTMPGNEEMTSLDLESALFEDFDDIMTESESTQIGCDDNYADNQVFHDVRKKSGYAGMGKQDYYADDQEMNDVGVSEGCIDLTSDDDFIGV